MSSRREFIATAVAAALAAAGSNSFSLAAHGGESATPKSLRILFLGGTGFIGPHHVRTAIARGHQVSIFNRGKSKADIPPEVERLVGDRESDLKSIQNRDWDAVIDLQTYAPRWVRTLGEALHGRVKHYTFISTVMTYARTGDIVEERSAVLENTDAVDPYAAKGPSSSYQYGSFKVLCEREAKYQFPGNTLIVRPGVITGPGDGMDHIAYWFARMERGGQILAPGDPLAPAQFIDARDLAEWVIRMVEQRETGLYNAVGPAMPMGMGELLGAVRSLFSVPMRLTWVPSQWLIKQKFKAHEAPFFWMKDPSLVPDPNLAKSELWLSYKVSSAKAHAKGLVYRPLAQTLTDNLEWYRTLPAERQAAPRSGWKPEFEQKLLAAWRENLDR